MSIKMKRYTASLFVCVACLAIGCSSGPGDAPEMGSVSGKVTLDGKPLAYANVTFIPVEGGNPSSGQTDESGNYKLHNVGSSMGAIIGKHKVSIKSGTPPGEGTDDAAPAVDGIEEEGGAAAAPKETIPAKYNSATELEEEVKAGSNTINFELKSS